MKQYACQKFNTMQDYSIGFALLLNVLGESDF